MKTKTIKYKSPVDLFRQLFELMYDVCRENDWQDPFSYARAKEIHFAGSIGHEVSKEYSGADGIDQDGECEYKTTIGKNISVCYSGISVKDTWKEQVKYLEEEKIAKYTNHYQVRYNLGIIQEAYTMTGTKVLEIILPKINKSFKQDGFTKTGKKKADPRLAATLTMTEIKKHGTKIR
jgi:hypothetical protein